MATCMNQKTSKSQNALMRGRGQSSLLHELMWKYTLVIIFHSARRITGRPTKLTILFILSFSAALLMP